GGAGLSGIDLSGVLTATDFDGDTATGATAGSFVLTIADDIPVWTSNQYLTNDIVVSSRGDGISIDAWSSLPVSIGADEAGFASFINWIRTPPFGSQINGSASLISDGGGSSWWVASTNFTSNGAPLYYAVNVSAPDEIILTKSATNPTTSSADFVAVIGASLGSQQLQVDVRQDIDVVLEFDFSSFSDASGGSGPKNFVFIGDNGVLYKGDTLVEAAIPAGVKVVATFLANGAFDVQTSNAVSSFKVAVENQWVTGDTNPALNETITIDIGLNGGTETALVTTDTPFNVFLEMKGGSSIPYQLKWVVTLSDGTTRTQNVDTIVDQASGDSLLQITKADLDAAIGADIVVYQVTKVELIPNTGTGSDEWRVGGISFSGGSRELPINDFYTVDVFDADGDKLTDAFKITFDPNIANPVTPVALDLDGSGSIDYLSVPSGVLLDPDGNGALSQFGWISSGDGILVYDYNSDGLISEGREFIFTMWGENPAVATDMQALAAYFDVDVNGVKDGVLDANDTAWSYLGVWQDLNVDGVQDDAEFVYLADWGITGIALAYNSDSTSYAAADGDVFVYGHMAVTLADGSIMLADDVAFADAPPDTSAVDPQATEPLSVLESPEFSAETTSEDVVIPETEALEADLVAVADLVNQFVAENVVSEETLVEYQQELPLTPDDSAFDANIDAGFIEPTADAIVALDAADFTTPDPADGGLGHAADLVDDFSYTV
ncbi:hypothetical protein KBY75_11250, partial [Cyanobium sp. T1G-Tous]|uniref:hypothetical protein n=1 Tax=Cyanobium sp. T1G-Tous TaxID=2823722 RepID=UPI0020CE5413